MPSPHQHHDPPCLARHRTVERGVAVAPLRRGAAAAAGAIGLLGVLVSGCTSDPAAAPPESTSSSSTGVRSTAAPTTGTTPSTGTATTPGTRGDPELTPEEQEVADAYRAAVDAFHEAYREPLQPALPALSDTMAGIMLSQTVAALERDRAAGLAARDGVDGLFSLEVVEVRLNGDAAEVAACVLDDVVMYRVESGEVLEDGVSRFRETAVFTRLGGSWKMSERRIDAEDVTTCDES